MGFWSKVKGVFGRIGNGLKKYVLKPALTLTKYAAAPVGTAIGSIIPGIGTVAGCALGTAASTIAGTLDNMIKW